MEQMKYWAECNNCKVQKVHLTYEQVNEFQKAHANCRKSKEDEEEELYN